MIEKCQLASDEISALEVMNSSTISGLLSQMDSLKATRLVVTDQSGTSLYDSAQTAMETTKIWIKRSQEDTWQGMGLPVERYF